MGGGERGDRLPDFDLGTHFVEPCFIPFLCLFKGGGGVSLILYWPVYFLYSQLCLSRICWTEELASTPREQFDLLWG